MKKLLALLLALLAFFSLSGCALLELMEDEKNVVQLGGDGEAVRFSTRKALASLIPRIS